MNFKDNLCLWRLQIYFSTADSLNCWGGWYDAYLLSRKINRLPISRNTVFLTVCRVHVRSALPPLLNGHQSSEPTILLNRLLRIFSTLLTFVIFQMLGDIWLRLNMDNVHNLTWPSYKVSQVKARARSLTISKPKLGQIAHLGGVLKLSEPTDFKTDPGFDQDL